MNKPGRAAKSRVHSSYYGTIVIFAFLLLGLALGWRHYASFRWELFVRTLGELNYCWVFAGAALALLSYVGRALRWKVMMLPAPSYLPRLISATFIGFSAVVLLGRAGELVRPYLIAKQESSTVPAQAAIWVLERLYDLLLVLLLFGVGLGQAGAVGLPAGSPLIPVLRVGGWLVSVAAIAAGTILYVLGRYPAEFRRRILAALSFLPEALQKRVEDTLDSFLQGARSMGNTRIVTTSFLLTVIEWAIVLGAIWC